MNHFKVGLFFCFCMNQSLPESKAQEEAEVEKVLKVNFISPGIAYETRVGRRQTIYSEAFLALYFGYSYSSNFGSSSFFRASPSLETGYRYYYNGNKRASKGVNTSLNSMNYLTFVYQPGFNDWAISDDYITEFKKRFTNTFGIAWGFQRNYENRISLDVYIGPACILASSTKINQQGGYSSAFAIAPTIVFKARVGLWLNKRKN